MEACINEIDAWVIHNKLKLNKDKTELLIIGAQHRTCPTIECIRVADECIYNSNSAKNIGIIFDQYINLEQQVASICKSAYFHMRNIAKIKNCLPRSDAETLVHAFITTKLDNCTSLLSAYHDILLTDYNVLKTLLLVL